MLLVILFCYAADNLRPVAKSFFQVDVKIDDFQGTPEDTVLSRFTIEASLYDTSGWYKGDADVDLISSNVGKMKLKIKSGASPGFQGYWLGGKLDIPKLWSAEKVRKLESTPWFNLVLFFFCCVLKLNA